METEFDSLNENVLESELALELDRGGHTRDACSHDDAAYGRSHSQPSASSARGGDPPHTRCSDLGHPGLRLVRGGRKWAAL